MRLKKLNEWRDFKRNEKRRSDKDKIGDALRLMAYGALAVRLILWAIGYFATFTLNESVITLMWIFVCMFYMAGFWVAGWIIRKLWRRL